MVRDSLRATGDTEAVIKGTLALVEKGMNITGQPMFEEAVEWSLKTLAAWARKYILAVDIQMLTGPLIISLG